MRTFRLPSELVESVHVGDRFHVKPLFRSITFPHAAWVLPLAKGDVRLMEVFRDGPPEEVPVADLPRDAWDPRSNAVFRARERNYVRQVDHALRGVLNGSDLPLVLAATETIAALYAAVNTYPHLLDTRWPGNPEENSQAELADGARSLLDGLYAQQMADLHRTFDERSSQGRAAYDISDLARLATIGAADTVLVDMDTTVSGSIDPVSGAVTFADQSSDGDDGDDGRYGVLDEIARRVYLQGGRVMAVRADDIPLGGHAAALLRYRP